jgi:hypothetical protein
MNGATGYLAEAVAFELADNPAFAMAADIQLPGTFAPGTGRV